jgi:hypothetical protein
VIALPSGKIKIILVDGTETLADITLLATGYKSVVPDLLSHLEPGGATHDIALEPLKNLNQVIGSRVMIDGHPTEGLYVAGPAAGMLASPEQMAASATGNPVSVNVMGQFTQALANHLLPMARKISLNPGSAAVAASFKPVITGRNISKDPHVLPILAKLELQRSLSKFSMDVNDLNFRISANGSQLVIKTSGLDSLSGGLLLKALGANERLLEVLQRMVASDGLIQIKIPVQGKSLIFEKTVLEIR